MNLTGKLIVLLVSSAVLSPVAWSQSSGGEDGSVAAAARRYRADKQLSNPCPPSQPCDADAGLSRFGQGEDEYRDQIHTLLSRSDFDGLDEEANLVRSSKARVKGGVWKLYLFYDEVCKQDGGVQEKDSYYAEHLALLNQWVAKRPDSITARVALAQCYYGHGWAARGTRSANKVGDAAWALFDERLSQALTILEEASKLPQKCPHSYYLLLALARSEGLPKKRARALFESAVAFEPDYYHSYREFALNLLPKWSGGPGEAEAFAEESRQSLGGDSGAFIYFEIATTIATAIYCQCGNDQPPTLSWLGIQEGFAAMEKEYGVTPLKLNRFALLAYMYHDRDVMKRTFARIGDNWDPSVWKTQAYFEKARASATQDLQDQSVIVNPRQRSE